jgi:GNAT superfamily N-acetyltransferase
MKLVPADGLLLDQILDDTSRLWSEGLTRDNYGRWNAAQQRTPWGRRRLQRFALVDARGDWLATAKRYRYTARLAGREIQMCGIGAVFTREGRRGRGYATAIVEQLLDQERREGVPLALLFSEIGTGFYERLGFTARPLDEVTVNVTMKGGSPAMLVRAGDDRDLPAIAAMHQVRAASAPFALMRDVPQIQFALARKRLLAGLGPAGRRQVEFFAAEEGASAVAYVVLSVNQYGWTLEEAGDRDPAGARLGAMLQVLLAREPSNAVPLIRTWWPRAFPVPPQLALADRSEPKDILMMKALGDIALPAAGDIFYWRSDQF